MEFLSSLLCQATRLAAEAHDGARRKGSGLPYILHAMETVEIVATMTGTKMFWRPQYCMMCWKIRR